MTRRDLGGLNEMELLAVPEAEIQKRIDALGDEFTAAMSSMPIDADRARRVLPVLREWQMFKLWRENKKGKRLRTLAAAK